MKKRHDLGFFGLLILSATNVFANSTFGNAMSGLNTALDGVLGVLNPVLELLFGSEFGSGSAGSLSSPFLVNIMILVIILVVVYLTLCQMPMFDHNVVARWVVTIAVSILSTRWMVQDQYGWIEAVLLPYSALGVTVTAFLPLILFFFFVEFGLNSRTLRRAAWIFFAVVYSFLWFGRYNELVTAGSPSLALWIYPTCLGACLFFFVFDGTIQNWWHKSKLHRVISKGNVDRANELNEKLAKLSNMNDTEKEGYQSHFKHKLTGPAAVGYDMKEYQKLIAKIRSDL